MSFFMGRLRENQFLTPPLGQDLGRVRVSFGVQPPAPPPPPLVNEAWSSPMSQWAVVHVL